MALVSRRSLLCAGLTLVSPACAARPAYPPPDSEGGWRTADAKPRAALDRLFRYVEQSTFHGGLLVVHRGWLVYERYFGLGAREATPNLASIGKSVTSVAAGIVIGEQPARFPRGLSQRISTPEHLPPEAFPLSDPRRSGIKLGQLLSMTAGLRGHSPAYVRGRPVTLDSPGPDGWEAMLDEAAYTVPLWCEPGAGYSYATASVHLASIVIRTAAGVDLAEFVRTRLAEPLGWSTWGYGHRDHPLPHTPGGGGICLRPTDLLRFGYLLLHRGVWAGRQLVPAEFVRHLSRASPYNPHYPYSLQFDVNSAGGLRGVPRDAYWKGGSGGHCLYVIPSLDLVAFKMGGRTRQYDPADTGLPGSSAAATPHVLTVDVDAEKAATETLRQLATAFGG